MDIAICKYGQKVIFNRESDECKRSNTNGNFGLYKLMSLLFNNNKEVTFTLLSKFDDISMFDNVTCEYDSAKTYDSLIVIAGIKEYENDCKFIETINTINTKKIIIVSQDPRCIKSMSNDNRLKIMPDVIITQTDEKQLFKGKIIDTIYLPIQTEECYCMGKFKACRKTNKFIVIANSTFSEYDRVSIVKDLIGDTNCEIYGRVSNIDDKRFKGEIKFDEVIDKIRHTMCTLLVPIEKGWVTSKYIEALMLGCVPIFYADYGTKLFGLDCILNKYIVSNNKELVSVIKWICENKDVVSNDMKILREKLVYKYSDGKILSNEIMKIVEGEINAI